ncbi:hypothetical protein DFJ73DRAFT_821543 [Zopfochytrium polystomum]|nr:hypothetical protein DFJ73DRAFT_821543 [Zopfochytrium polystomum]
MVAAADGSDSECADPRPRRRNALRRGERIPVDDEPDGGGGGGRRGGGQRRGRQRPRPRPRSAGQTEDHLAPSFAVVARQTTFPSKHPFTSRWQFPPLLITAMGAITLLMIAPFPVSSISVNLLSNNLRRDAEPEAAIGPPTTETAHAHPTTAHPLLLILSLLLTVVIGMAGGRISDRWFKQSPLLGMLIAGVLARNLLPAVILPLPHTWTARLWGVALSAVSARAGLSLHLSTFTSIIPASEQLPHSPHPPPTILSNPLSGLITSTTSAFSNIPASTATTALLLGTLPILGEALFLSNLARMIFRLPTAWAFTLAFGVASISPGVVVPLLLNLQERREWRNSKLPQTLLAATGLDVLVATTGFGVSLAAVFGHSHEGSGTPHLEHSSWFARGVEEVFFGVLGGALFGTLAFIMRKAKIAEFIATPLLFTLTTVAMLTAKGLGFPGSASSCVILSWAAVANVWDKDAVDDANKRLKLVWKYAEPFLFPLIGASVCFVEISPSLLFTAMLCVVSSVLVKMLFAFLAASAAGLNSEEQTLTAGVWSGKASVQAALSTVTVEAVQQYHLQNTPDEVRSRIVFAFMVCAILIGGPLAATWVSVFGGRSGSAVLAAKVDMEDAAVGHDLKNAEVDNSP